MKSRAGCPQKSGRLCAVRGAYGIHPEIDWSKHQEFQQKQVRMKELKDLPQINYLFWVFQTLAMMLTGWLVPGFKVVNPIGAFLMVIALAFVNSHIWDAALFFEIPNSLTSRTFTLIVANGIIFWLLVKLLPYIEIRGCLAAIAAPVIFTLLSILIGYAGENVDWIKVGNSTKTFIEGVKKSLEKTKSEKQTNNLDPRMMPT